MTSVVHQECGYEDDKLTGQHPVRYWWLKANRKSQSDPGWGGGNRALSSCFSKPHLEFSVYSCDKPFKHQYPHTNSPDWSPYISLKNKLREYDERFTHVNRKWETHPEHVNKCRGVREILQVTITIIDPRLYQSTQFLCTTWNSPMKERKPNIDIILPFKESLEVRNETKSESLSKVQDQESLIYQIYITFLHWFSKYVHV